METLDIRQAKSHLSRLVRAAADGKSTFVIDNGRLAAMIAPPLQSSAPAATIPEGLNQTARLSDAAAFRSALFGALYPLDVDF